MIDAKKIQQRREEWIISNEQAEILIEKTRKEAQKKEFAHKNLLTKWREGEGYPTEETVLSDEPQAEQIKEFSLQETLQAEGKTPVVQAPLEQIHKKQPTKQLAPVEKKPEHKINGIKLLITIGVIFLATGFLILISSNRSSMGDYGKIMIWMLSMLGTFWGGRYLALYKKSSIKIGRALLILAPILFLGNLLLLSQIYHTDGNIHQLILMRTIGVIPTMYLFKNKKITWIIASLFLVRAGFFIFRGLDFWVDFFLKAVFVFFGVGSLMITIAKLHQKFPQTQEFAPPFLAIGRVVCIASIILLGSQFLHRGLYNLSFSQGNDTSSVLIISILASLGIILRAVLKEKKIILLEFFPLLYMGAIYIFGVKNIFPSENLFWLCNWLLLAYSIIIILYQGKQENNKQFINFGFILISAWFFERILFCFDNISSLIPIAIGIGSSMLSLSLLYKKLTGEENQIYIKGGKILLLSTILLACTRLVSYELYAHAQNISNTGSVLMVLALASIGIIRRMRKEKDEGALLELAPMLYLGLIYFLNISSFFPSQEHFLASNWVLLLYLTIVLIYQGKENKNRNTIKLAYAIIFARCLERVLFAFDDPLSLMPMLIGIGSCFIALADIYQNITKDFDNKEEPILGIGKWISLATIILISSKFMSWAIYQHETLTSNLWIVIIIAIFASCGIFRRVLKQGNKKALLEYIPLIYLGGIYLAGANKLFPSQEIFLYSNRILLFYSIWNILYRGKKEKKKSWINCWFFIIILWFFERIYYGFQDISSLFPILLAIGSCLISLKSLYESISEKEKSISINIWGMLSIGTILLFSSRLVSYGIYEHASEPSSIGTVVVLISLALIWIMRRVSKKGKKQALLEIAPLLYLVSIYILDIQKIFPSQQAFLISNWILLAYLSIILLYQGKQTKNKNLIKTGLVLIFAWLGERLLFSLGTHGQTFPILFGIGASLLRGGELYQKLSGEKEKKYEIVGKFIIIGIFFLLSIFPINQELFEGSSLNRNELIAVIGVVSIGTIWTLYSRKEKNIYYTLPFFVYILISIFGISNIFPNENAFFFFNQLFLLTTVLYYYRRSKNIANQKQKINFNLIATATLTWCIIQIITIIWFAGMSTIFLFIKELWTNPLLAPASLATGIILISLGELKKILIKKDPPAIVSLDIQQTNIQAKNNAPFPYSNTGRILNIVVLFLISIHAFATNLYSAFNGTKDHRGVLMSFLVLAVLALNWRRKKLGQKSAQFEIIPLLYFAVLYLFWASKILPWEITFLIINQIILAIAIGVCFYCANKEKNKLLVNVGFVAIIGWIIEKFFSVFRDKANIGILLIIGGTVLLIIVYLIEKQRRRIFNSFTSSDTTSWTQSTTKPQQ